MFLVFNRETMLVKETWKQPFEDTNPLLLEKEKDLVVRLDVPGMALLK